MLSECPPSPDVEMSSTTRPRDARLLERQHLRGDEEQLTMLEKALAEEQQLAQPPTYSIRERFRTKLRCCFCCVLTMIVVLLNIMIPCVRVYSERHRLVGPARTYYLEQRPAVLAAARRMHLQWYWAQATPDISVLEINSGGQGSYLGDWFLVYEEEPPVESAHSTPPWPSGAGSRCSRLRHAPGMGRGAAHAPMEGCGTAQNATQSR